MKNSKAGRKGVSQRVADQTVGGFLDDADAVIADAEYFVDEFEVTDDDGSKRTVSRCSARVEYEVEGREENVDITYSIGGTVAPSEDGETESETGQYVVGKDGKDFKGFTKDCGWGKFLASLVVKAKFPDENLDYGPRAALAGLAVHLNSVPGGKYKGKEGRPIPVVTKLDKGTIPDPTREIGTAAKGKKATSKGKVAAVAGRGKPKVEDEEPEEDSDDELATAVTEAIQKAVAKGALAKAKLSTAVKKLLEKAGLDEEQVVEGVKTALSSQFLKEGAAEDLWSFDGREIGPADSEDDDAEDEE